MNYLSNDEVRCSLRQIICAYRFICYSQYSDYRYISLLLLMISIYDNSFGWENKQNDYAEVLSRCDITKILTF